MNPKLEYPLTLNQEEINKILPDFKLDAVDITLVMKLARNYIEETSDFLDGIDHLELILLRLLKKSQEKLPEVE